MQRFHPKRQVRSVGNPKNRMDVHEEVRDMLRDHTGYVLVTCRRSSKKKDSLEVELSFEGDPDLASYLVDGAQGYFENEEMLENA